jgi:hypothetical protein
VSDRVNRRGTSAPPHLLAQGFSMKIALAVLALCPALASTGCKQKPPPSPPPSAIIGEWACAIKTDKASARIDVVFAADGNSTSKIALSANAEGKRVLGKLSAAGQWRQNGDVFSQSLDKMVVSVSTTNGLPTPKSSAAMLARSLALEDDRHAIGVLNETEFDYATEAGTVRCTR